MKKKFLLLTLFMCLLGLYPININAQETVTIDGDDTSNNVPVRTYGRYSMSQTIYNSTILPSQLKSGCTITSIAYYVTESGVDLGGQGSQNLKRKLVIYISEIAETSFSGTTYIVSNEVYNGEKEFVVGDWTTIELTNPITYQGGNLMICVCDNTNAYTWNNTSFKTFYNGNNVCLRTESTQSYPTTDTYSGMSSTQIPCIQFTFTSGDATPTVTLKSPANGKTDVFNESLEFTVSNATEYQLYMEESAATGATNPTTAKFADWQTVDGNSITLPLKDLNIAYDGKSYVWKVVVKNDDEEEGTCDPFTFTTKNVTSAPEPIKEATPNGIEVDSNPELSWTFGENTEEYQVYLGTYNDSDSNIEWECVKDWTNTENKTTASYQTSNLASNTVYYWKVITRNGVGETSSDVFSFKKLGAPDNVTPIYPTDGATGVSTDATLTWEFDPITTHYRVLMGESADGLSYQAGSATEWIVVDGQTGSFDVSKYKYDIRTNTTYYWAIDVKNGSGIRTIWQGGDPVSTFSFTTTSIDAATLEEPANNATITVPTATLKWKYVGDAAEYQVCYGTDQNNLTAQGWTDRSPGENITDPYGKPEDTFTIENLAPATTYYWKVQVRKDGIEPIDSEVWSFTTIGLPEAVTDMQPIDGGTSLELKSDPELSWTFGANTSEYQVLLGTTNPPTDVVVDWTSTLATSYQTSGLASNVTYYWQVNVRNAFGEVTSTVYSFMKALRPDNVTPIDPVDGATGVSTNAILTWTFAPNTTHYRVLVDIGNGDLEYLPNSNWIEVTGDTGSFDTDGLGLKANTTYSWAVDVKNANGERCYYGTGESTGGANLYTYTTSDYAAATYMSPADKSVITTPAATLQWSYGEQNIVTHYQVLFGTKDNLVVVQDWTERPAVGTGLAGANSYTTADLVANTKYYWQVNVKKGVDGTPLEGKTWSFISMLSVPQNVKTDGNVYSSTAHITWDAISEATSYDVYVDGNYYTTVTTNAADITDLSYNNGNPYGIEIAARYEFDGDVYISDKSAVLGVQRIGYGRVEVLVRDEKANPIASATLTLDGTDAFGNNQVYTFTTAANGLYESSTFEICEGTYTATISKDGYIPETISNVVIVSNDTKDLGIVVLHSMGVFDVTVINVNVDYLDIFLGYNNDDFVFEGHNYNVYIWEIHEDTYDPDYIVEWFSIGATGGENIMHRFYDWKDLPNGIYKIGVQYPGHEDINWSNVFAYKNYYIFEKEGNWFDETCWKDELMPQLEDDQVYIHAPATVNADQSVTIGNAEIRYQPDQGYQGALNIYGEFTATTDIGIVNEAFHRLVIYDGAQLRQKNSELYAKLVMDIDNPTEWTIWNKTGWQFISSPFTSEAEVSQFTDANDEYDLYKFDGRHENLTVEWRNHKDPEAAFEKEFVLGRGYMVSYKTNETASLHGVLNAGTSIDYPVTYQEILEGETHWPNFHLVGNPFTFNMDLSKLKTFHMATGVAVVNGVGTWDYATSGTIKVGDGFFVRSVGVNPSVSYSEEATRGGDETIDNINIVVRDKNTRDNVVLNFAGSDKVGFPKMKNFNEDAPCIYVDSESSRYGIFNYDRDVKEVPLSFESKKMANYTISIETEGEYEYVVLVDRLTGIETNMLLEDYNFTATSSMEDNADRFILRMALESDVEVVTDRFAYQSGEDLIIKEEGAVQIFDVTGRMVYNNDVESTNKRIYIGDLDKAAYILRLLNEEGVKVQKVIIY